MSTSEHEDRGYETDHACAYRNPYPTARVHGWIMLGANAPCNLQNEAIDKEPTGLAFHRTAQQDSDGIVSRAAGLEFVSLVPRDVVARTFTLARV
ncbi:MAG TPA: hypothetical protein VFF58_00140 [Candidatus Nitrosotalea sp.]|nr:hypothetical protein [Candidatus Nitrosotalea sp.]